MRISSGQIYQSALDNILRAQRETLRSQEEVSSGKRVLSPADDPPAATLALRIEQDIARSEQYLRNVEVAERDLRQQESQLQAVENILFRLRELTIQAGDGALSTNERQSLIAEAEALADQLVGIGNSQLANGEYLFSGFQGDTVPFVRRSTGVVEYRGDDGRRFLQINSSVDVEVRDNGRKLFVDVPAANNNFVTRVSSANTGSADIDVGRVVDQAAWDAVFPDDLVVTFTGPATYDISQRDRVTGALTPITVGAAYVDGQTITAAGAEFTIVGAPAAGDEFVLQASNRQSLVSSVQRLIAGLRAAPDTPVGNTERARVVAETLNNLDRAESQIFEARAELGSRLNAVDLAREDQAQTELLNREILSEVIDVDFNEAVSNLSFQSFVLQAAQQSFTRIANLSLFNFLR